MDPRTDSYKTVEPPKQTYAPNARRNNTKGSVEGLDADAVDRFKVRELCEGWPTYRDAAEWENFRSLFHDDAYIATSWSQGPIDDFISDSKKAFASQKDGMFYILHRMIGQTVDVQGRRAVSKMKVTITCRVNIDNKEMDNEADCRFFFLLEKRKGRWGICFFTLLFDKDKMVVVNPDVGGFYIPEDEVAKFPRDTDLNSHGPERDILYSKCRDWLEGKKVRPNLTGKDAVSAKL